MGITADFLIKHVRPLGQGGYDLYASQELITYLSQGLNLNIQDIASVLALWRTTALADPETESNVFVSAARAVAEARWGELYPTSASTLMFLDANQLVSLSQYGAQVGANRNFGWRAPTEIEIVVTLRRNGGSHVLWGVDGFYGATDGNANVVHFDSLM